jgi:hypothetical protein
MNKDDIRDILELALGFALLAFAFLAIGAIIWVTLAPTSAFGAQRVGRLLMPQDVETRVAVFVIPVNTEEADTYTGFDLMASTDKFATTNFHAQSDVADAAVPGMDGMRLFVCTSKEGSAAMSYTPIDSTLAWTNRLTSVVAVVGASQLASGRNASWLRGGNTSLEWSYLRSRPVSPAYEYEDGTDEGQWRPVIPTWFKNMPEWAK